MHADVFRTLPLVWCWPRSVCWHFSAGISLRGTILTFLGCQKKISRSLAGMISTKLEVLNAQAILKSGIFGLFIRCTLLGFMFIGKIAYKNFMEEIDSENNQFFHTYKMDVTSLFILGLLAVSSRVPGS